LTNSELYRLLFGPEPSLHSFDVSDEEQRWQFLWRLSEIGEAGLIPATAHVWDSLSPPRKTRCILMGAVVGVGGAGKVALHAVLAKFLEDFEMECCPPDLPLRGDFESPDLWHAAVSAHFGLGMDKADQVISRYSKILNGEHPYHAASLPGAVIAGPWKAKRRLRAKERPVDQTDVAPRIERLVSGLRLVLEGVYEDEFIVGRRTTVEDLTCWPHYLNLLTLAIDDGWTGSLASRSLGGALRVPGDLTAYFETLFRAELLKRMTESPILKDIHRGILQSQVVFLQTDLRNTFPFDWDGSPPWE
jgi:hypothetical protein